MRQPQPFDDQPARDGATGNADIERGDVQARCDVQRVRCVALGLPHDVELQLAFVTVVDTGSITAAADELSQTASGISRAINRLEKKLETTLLRRTTRRLELTEEGAAFLARARAILDALDLI